MVFYHLDAYIISSALDVTGVIKASAIPANVLTSKYQYIQAMDSNTGKMYKCYIRQDTGNLCAGEAMPASNGYFISGYLNYT